MVLELITLLVLCNWWRNPTSFINATEELFTGAGADIGAWATETSMNTARYDGGGCWNLYNSFLLVVHQSLQQTQLNEIFEWNFLDRG